MSLERRAGGPERAPGRRQHHTSARPRSSETHRWDDRPQPNFMETSRHWRLEQPPSLTQILYHIQITGLESTLQISHGKYDPEKCKVLLLLSASILRLKGRFSSTGTGGLTQMPSRSITSMQQQLSKQETDETLRENTFSNTLLNHPQPGELCSIS